MSALISWWTLDLRELVPEAHSDAVSAIGADLLRRLDEPHRRYHTARHLVEMFHALEELEEEGELQSGQATVARIAAWFHDAVYDPSAFAGSNEEDSAGLAATGLRSLGAASEVVDTVRGLVLATARHDQPADGGLAAAFHDADLWILSAPQERFDEYCAQVREEYAAVPDDDYARGRSAVLEAFLRRDDVYATGAARAAWTDRARVNLARELSRLSAPAR